MLPDGVRARPLPPPPPPPPPPPARHVEHKVQRGETLTEVSTRYRTSVDQLKDANPDIANPDVIPEGRTVRVPIGPGYGVDPIERKVEPGDTLADLAAQYRQPPANVALANRHATGPSEPLVVGQKLWIPGTRTPEVAPASAPLPPLEQKVQATDAAVQRVAEAQRQYDDMNASTQGRGAAVPYLSDNLAAAKRQLDTAVQDETALRAGPGADAAAWGAASDALAQRYAGDPASAALVDAASQRVTVARDAQAVVDTARAAGDPQKAMQSLSDQYTKASPEVQAALNVHDGARGIVDDAVTWALDPLQHPPADAVGPQAGGREAMARLDTLTASLDPALAGRVVLAATPGIEAHTQRYQGEFGSQPFGPDGMRHLVHTLGRVADAPGGAAAIDRLAKLGLYDQGGISQAIAEGAHPAYAIALARQPGIDATRVMETVHIGIGGMRQRIEDDVQAYSAHMEELSWLVANHGGSMTPEQLDAAIADYKKTKGPQWEATAEELRQKLADDGEALLAQLDALDQLPPELAEHQPAITEQLEATLQDTNAQLAIRTALQTRPEIMTGDSGQRLLEWVNTSPLAVSAKVTDQFRKMAQEFATAHVQATVFNTINRPDFDARNPASVQRALDAVEALRSNRPWAQAMGLQGDALNKTIDKLKAAVPAADDTAEMVALRLKDLDDHLDGLKGFDKSTYKGQMLRGVGLALAGVGFLSSIDRAQMDPSLKNNLRIIVDAAGLGQKGIELYAGLTNASSTSLSGRLGGALASKLLGSLTAGFDAWSAAESFAKGDVASGVLYGVGAGGGLLAALGTGSLAGPIGLGLVVVSAVGLAIVAGRKETDKHEPQNDKGVSMAFLRHADLDEDTARALTDQSGDGHSVVPLLEQYAQLKGVQMDDPAARQRYADWLDAMTPEQLGALRDSLHRTIDDFEGDPSRLTATADDDAWVVADTEQRPWFAATGSAQPESAAQIDAVLKVLGVPALG